MSATVALIKLFLSIFFVFFYVFGQPALLNIAPLVAFCSRTVK